MYEHNIEIYKATAPGQPERKKKGTGAIVGGGIVGGLGVASSANVAYQSTGARKAKRYGEFLRTVNSPEFDSPVAHNSVAAGMRKNPRKYFTRGNRVGGALAGGMALGGAALAAHGVNRRRNS